MKVVVGKPPAVQGRLWVGRKVDRKMECYLKNMEANRLKPHGALACDAVA